MTSKVFNITNLKKAAFPQAADSKAITQVNFYPSATKYINVNIKRGFRGTVYHIYPATYVQLCQELKAIGFEKTDAGRSERWTRKVAV